MTNGRLPDKHIGGLIISGYRSFGPEPQRVGPFRKITFLIRKNNCGKSNVLRFLKLHYPNLLTGSKLYSQDDAHRGISSGTPTLGFGVIIPTGDLPAFLRPLLPREFPHLEYLAAAILQTSLHESGLLWFAHECDRLGEPLGAVTINNSDISALGGLKNFTQWADICATLCGKYHNQPSEDMLRLNIVNALTSLSRHLFVKPEVEIIPAIREVRAGQASGFDCSGLNLIGELAKFQNPTHREQEQRVKFDQLNNFLRYVTDKPEACLEIPHDRSTILVHMDNKVMPLECVGTGIHEVVILATAATVFDDRVICIEEPEIHVHPDLQRKLVRYLCENTTNQYVIATHSAHLLDTSGAGVCHVVHDGSATRVRTAEAPSDHQGICADLGYRASDLLQANSIVWVEGPSDRLYVRHWLAAADQSLVDGLHYSIMFYGGRLLTHLSADDRAVSDFIALRSLNRFTCVLMDSDKQECEAEPNATKQRISKELADGGIAWVTAGREIENYIPVSILIDAIHEVSGSDATLEPVTQFSRAYLYRSPGASEPSKADKLKLAHYVVSKPADLSVYDLSERMKALVRFIRNANGLPLGE